MITSAIVSDLCRYPMWLIDHIEVTGTRFIANGWALPYGPDRGGSTITLNNRPADVLSWHNSPGIQSVMPDFAGSDKSRFVAEWSDFRPGPAAVKLCYAGRLTLEPYNRWQNSYFDVAAWRDERYVRPSAAQMKRTQGSDNFFRYVLGGSTTVNTLDAIALSYAGRSLHQFSDICDWGAGCGRVIQALRRYVDGPTLTGLEIDLDNVNWCNGAIPGAEFHHVSLLPPTDLPTGSFDLLYGVSVFTHLTLEAAIAWRDEIHRLVRPNGFVIVSILSGLGALRQRNENLITSLFESGFDASSPDRSLTGFIETPEYYRGSYMTAQYARDFFGGRFLVRDILPQANGTHQDIVVCERTD